MLFSKGGSLPFATQDCIWLKMSSASLRTFEGRFQRGFRGAWFHRGFRAV